MVNITLENIKKIYPNGFEAIKGDGISIDIQTGEFIAILGPSGCGKSSLLRMVAGLEEITSGNLIINDKIVNKLEPAERNVAMVFQNYALYPHMTVYQNLSYGLKNLKVPKDEITERIARVAGNLHIEHLLDRKPHQLSGGQRQRVAMGRAIVRKPDYFLFDEPLSNLDARLRIKIRQDIERLQKKLQITTLYVTHDQVEAMAMADRIVVMNEGDVLQIGTPKELYNTPKTLFVATFIGSDTINIFPVEQDDNNLKILNTNVNFSCTKADILNNTKTIAIRPEHFAINHHEGYLALESVIENIEYLGTYGLCYVTVGDVQICIRVRNQYLDEIFRNNALTLYINPENIMAFDDKEKYIGNL